MMNEHANPVKVPPLKIQGIKTKLVSFILNQVKWDGRGRWVEPFLGSGVVVLNVNPERALLADANEHIIRFYRAIQTGEMTPYELRCFLEREGHSLKAKGQVHYYELRERFNAHHSPFDFLFLNRACFNGMMRFNAQGKFNVPFCRKPERFARAYVTKICNQVAWAGERIKGRDWHFAVWDWRDTALSNRMKSTQSHTIKLTLHRVSVQALIASCPSYNASTSVFYLIGRACRPSDSWL